MMRPIWGGVSASLDSNTSRPSERAPEGSLSGRNSDKFRRARTDMLGKMPLAGVTEAEDAWSQPTLLGSSFPDREAD